MNKTICLKKYILLILTVLIANVTFSQKPNFIKFNLTNEFVKNKPFILGFGASIERHVTEHSGLETGVLYRAYKIAGSIRGGDLFYDYTVNEKHLSIPVLYKYYSSMIDFSIGPTVDFYGGWSVNKNSSNIKVVYNEGKKDFGIGVLARASKTIHVDDRFYLEPEIHYNPLLLIKRNFVGFGLWFKCKL